MPHFWKTKRYARSVMERAILDASQFAHVPEATIREFMDKKQGKAHTIGVLSEYETARGPVSYRMGFAYAFYALSILIDLEEEFGTLCPVCLRQTTPPHSRIVEYADRGLHKIHKINSLFFSDTFRVNNTYLPASIPCAECEGIVTIANIRLSSSLAPREDVVVELLTDMLGSRKRPFRLWREGLRATGGELRINPRRHKGDAHPEDLGSYSGVRECDIIRDTPKPPEGFSLAMPETC